MKPTMVVWVVLTAAGCTRTEAPASESSNKASAPNVAADNTKKNEGDQGASALTPGDQAENAVDRTITQQIRQVVVKEDDLSSDGKNVKIITVDGVVTLRGPVQNAQEKVLIAAAARRVEGVKRVDDQLEIAAK